MFIKIRSNHNDGIDNGKKNQNITVIPFSVYKIEENRSEKKQ